MCPEVEVQLFDLKSSALLDSGSEISCISEELYVNICSQYSNKIPCIPVPSAQIITATGNKSCKINKQILVPITIDNVVYDTILLVVKKLIRPVILGADWLIYNGAVVDFYNSKTLLKSTNQVINCMNGGNATLSCCVNSIEKESEHSPLFSAEDAEDEEGLDRDNKNNLSLEDVVAHLDNLDPPQKARLCELLLYYKNVFSDKPGLTNLYEHKIDLTNYAPWVQKSYPVPLAFRDPVAREIQKMLEWRVIERACSPYVNPILPVAKKDKSVRLCLDARLINTKIVPDRERPENPEELLQRFHDAKWLTTVDLTASYWQIPLRVEDRQYTAFLYNGHMYQFTVIPYGLSTSVASFTRCMDIILGREIMDFSALYVDDLLIASPDFDTHMIHLSMVFERLQRAGMTIRLKKSFFCRVEVPYLGHILTPTGIYPDPQKIVAIQNFPVPRNKLDLQSFFGTISYYRRFVWLYSTATYHLRVLLKNDAMWRWGETEQNCFDEVKRLFLSTVMLRHPIPGKRFYCQTDACNYGLSGVLYNIDDVGDHMVISFASRSLRGPEVNYTTTEKELLSIVYSLKKFRFFVLGNPLTVITDHKALTFMMRARLTGDRLTRWILALQEYAFDIQYCKGSDNIVADNLSRYPHDMPEGAGACNAAQTRGLMVAKIRVEFDKSLKQDLKKISELQQADKKLSVIISSLNNTSVQLPITASKYVINNKNILFKKDVKGKYPWRACVPESLQDKLVRETHGYYGHYGANKVFNILAEHFVFPNMRRKIRKILSYCDSCQRCKVPNVQGRGELNPILPAAPAELVALDFYGPLPRARGGVKYILVVLDVFTKFVKIYALKSATTNSVLKKILGDYVTNVQKPIKILSDHGTQFTSKRWRNTLEQEGIQICFSSIRHPMSNPSERIMKELGRLFRTFCHNKHTTWIDLVPKINTWMNVVTHSSTGFTPYEMHNGVKPPRELAKLFDFPSDEIEIGQEQRLVLAREHMQKAANVRKRYHDQKGHLVTYAVGDLVLLKNPHMSSAINKEIKKFFHLFTGPYVVQKVLGKNAYLLVCPKSGKELEIYNVNNMQPYVQCAA